MTMIRTTLATLLLLACSALAQLQLAIDPSTNSINWSFDVPSGKTIAFEAGSQLTFFGSAVTDAATMRTAIGLGSVENTALSTWAGSTNVTTLGTIATGTWNGSVIGHAYLGSGGGGGTKFLRDDGTWQTIAGGGDALVANPLSQFASTTSLQLAGVISNETGGGLLVFATSPTLTTPQLNSASINGATITSLAVAADSGGNVNITFPATSANQGLAIDLASASRTLTFSDDATIGGVNTGDQTITLTGAVTGSGTASFATTLANNAVTSAKITDGTIVNADISATAAIAGSKLDLDLSSEVATMVSDETGTGVLVFATSPNFTTGITIGSVSVPTISSTHTLTNKTLGSGTAYSDDVRHTFNPGTNNAGINVGGHTVDPSAPANGDLFYDSDDHLLRAYVASAWTNLLSSASIDTSAELRAILGDESGTGAALFAGGNIGAATGTSLSLSGAFSAINGGFSVEATFGTVSLKDGTTSGAGAGGPGMDINGRGGNGAESGVDSAAGGAGGAITMIGGNAAAGAGSAAVGGAGGTFTASGGNAIYDSGTAYAGGGGGTLDLSGSNAVAGAAGNSGGIIISQGGTNGPGGTLDMSDGGGSIDTTAGGSLTTGSGDLNGSALSGTIALADAVNAWGDGIKQTFNPDGTTAGINVGSVAGDPGTPANGDLWYDSTANELTARINGSNVALGAGGAGAVATDTIWDAKGDLAVGTGSNTASRLAVGTNGLAVVADSAEATGVKWAAPVVDNYLTGLGLSNNGTDPVNDIDIATGFAADTAGAVMIRLSSALTKRIDASWTVGTNQGGLDGTESSAGTPDTSTWYHVWLIRRSDTAVVDVLFSESATSPTMPASYDAKRRLGAVYNDGSGDVKAFTQDGDWFRWVLFQEQDESVSGTASTATVLVPTGVRMLAHLRFATTTGVHVLVTQLDETDSTPSSTYNDSIGSDVSVSSRTPYSLMTNTSAGVRLRATGAGTVSVSTRGWTDTRGK